MNGSALPNFSPVALPPGLNRQLKPYGSAGGGSLAAGRAYEIPGWSRMGMSARLAFLRKLIEGTTEDSGWQKDPQIKELARKILVQAKVQDAFGHPESAWAALLGWVQAYVPYVNEPGEQFQSPQYTLECVARGMGGADCDDLMILLASLGGSIGLPWRMVIYGTERRTGRKIRYVESPQSHEGVSFMMWDGQGQARTSQLVIGGPVPTGVVWQHIYLACGLGALKASCYTFAEPTLKVPLGWDAYDQKYTGGGRTDLDGRAMAGLFAGAEEAATAPATQGTWLNRTWEDIKANVKPGQVVAAVLPSLILLMVSMKLEKKGKGR